MSRTTRVLVHGAVAGTIAATVLALWFLAIDWAAHAPLRTPAFLAGALLGMGQVQPTAGVIVPYTIFHYAVFIVLGILVAWLLGSVPAFRGVIFGAVVGFLLFDLLFYAGLIASGTNVIGALGWPDVLLGDVVAGVAMMVYLGIAVPAPAAGEAWLPALRAHRTVREGVVTGLIGAVALALWFLLLDALTRRILFTPGALGSAVFFGATSPSQVTIDFATVAGYTLLHFAAFIITGIVAAAVARGADESPHLLMAIVLLAVVSETLFIGLVAIAANWILGTVAWWTVAVGNLVAVAAMGTYLWRAHPRLHDHMREPLENPA